jgi:competence protein ComEC
MAEIWKKFGKWTAVGVLILTNIFVWNFIVREDRHGTLTVAFLDVGQGDAVYIEAPNGNQVLIDGGPDRKVLKSLGGVMPFYDHSIDLVVETHPDADHVGGLSSVLSAYSVEGVVEPFATTSVHTAPYVAFISAAAKNESAHIVARRGERVILSPDVYLDFLFPDRDLATDIDTNNESVVARLVYENTSFLFTGDAPQVIEKYLATIYGESLHSNVLKLGHHGSKTSTSETFLGYVNPDYVVISVGKDNRYGHPNKETLDELDKFKIKTLRTDEEGTIIMKSDGKVVGKI